MSQARPLALPVLTRQQAADARLRHAPRAVLPIGPGRRLALDAPSPCAPGPYPVRIALGWGGHRMALCCPAEPVRAALRALDPELAPADTLLPALAGLLLDAAFLDAMRAWEASTGCPASVEAVSFGSFTPGDGLAMSLHDGAQRHRVHLECTPPQAAAMLRSWPVVPRAMDWAPLPAALRLGMTRLPRRVAASVRPGDAVLMQHHAGGDARLVVAESRIAAAGHANGRWTLTEALRTPLGHEQGEWTMADQQADAESAADLDDVPVTLTFEVGRLSVQLGQLRRYGPGSVVELGRSRQELVEIAAGGRPIGQGELVEIEGAVGVRIVRLFDHG